MRLLVLLLRDAQRAKVIYAQLTFSMCQDSDSEQFPMHSQNCPIFESIGEPGQ